MGVLTVRQLTEYIRYVLKDEFVLQDLEVRGEVSNLSRNKSGNVYFTLKDDTAVLKCVIWQADDMDTNLLEEGHEVVAMGAIGVVERMGSYQLVVRDLKTVDIGELYRRFEKLKEALFKEGLFDPSRKKPLPKYPFAIGVATSDTGAAVRDIITTLHRRFPCADIYLYPTIVQGENAPASILHALQELDDRGLDLIIVGRGGGSFEDLAAFSDESVVRTIADMKTPVISAVGHEVDHQLSDAVADIRAATPTAAAELATPRSDDLIKALAVKKDHMNSSVLRALKSAGDTLVMARRELDRMRPDIVLAALKGSLSQAKKVFQYNSPLARMEREREKLFILGEKLKAHSPKSHLDATTRMLEKHKLAIEHGIRNLLEAKKQALEMQSVKLGLLNPENVLAKGYSILTTPEGEVLHTADVRLGSILKAQLVDGTLTVEVKDKEI